MKRMQIIFISPSHIHSGYITLSLNISLRLCFFFLSLLLYLSLLLSLSYSLLFLAYFLQEHQSVLYVQALFSPPLTSKLIWPVWAVSGDGLLVKKRAWAVSCTHRWITLILLYHCYLCMLSLLISLLISDHSSTLPQPHHFFLLSYLSVFHNFFKTDTFSILLSLSLSPRCSLISWQEDSRKVFSSNLSPHQSTCTDCYRYVHKY